MSMKWLRLLLIAIGIAIGLYAIGFFAVSFYVDRTYVVPAFADAKESATKYSGALLADIRWAKERPFFAAAKAENDAGLFLNDKITWKTAEGERVGALGETYLAFPKWVRSLKADTACSDEQKLFLARIDTAWIHDLRNHDHWELSSGNSPLQVSSPDSPIPDLAMLRTWAIIHLLKSQNDIGEAENDIRHFARLLVSNEILLSEMVAIAVLEDIDRAGGDCGFTKEELVRLRRMLWALSFNWAITTPADIRRSVDDEAKDFIGRCAGLTESAVIALGIRALTEDQYQAYYQDLDNAEAGVCRLRLFSQTKKYFDNQPGRVFGEKIGFRIPGVKRLMGASLVSLAGPAPYRYYENTN